MSKQDSFAKGARERFDETLRRFGDKEQVHRARDWLRVNQGRVETLFEYQIVRDFVFEPIKDIFKVPGEGATREARTIITQVALVNAVIAGLPGSLGVGVFVSIGLELWMAYALSRVLGLGLSRDEAIRTVVAWAASAGLVLVGFKLALNAVFPLVTTLMPVAGFGTAITQLIVTNVFGVIFWVMFEELREGRSFKFPTTSTKRFVEEMSALLTHQFKAGAQSLSPSNLVTVGGRLKVWLLGEVPTDLPRLKGEIAAACAMVLLLSRRHHHLESPLAGEFIEAIRDRYPNLRDASAEAIAQHMDQYSADQMVGVISLIKGRLFERLVARHENQDSDEWRAVLHDDQNYPGSDLIFENAETGETVEVSLKSTDDLGYLEESLLKYPEFPIVSTDEVAAAFGNDDLVWASGISNEQVTEVTEENFDCLLRNLSAVDEGDAVSAGVGSMTLVTLWPFVIAHLRNRIDTEQLLQAFATVLPQGGKVLASRIAYAAVFGPVFAWWLLARSVMFVSARESDHGGEIRRLLMLRN